jgi:uncharacterized protein (TIGR00730 family)
MSIPSAVVVYCGSRAGNHPKYAAMATAVGELFAKRGITLVYGGGSVGLMGILARACMTAGGRVIGVIPTFLADLEVAQTGLTELIQVPTMHARKQLMLDRSDACLAIPGGIGTLDEVIEVMTWAQLGLHSKPMWLLGDDDYWRPLLTLFAHLKGAGFFETPLDSLTQPLDDFAHLERVLTGQSGSR